MVRGVKGKKAAVPKKKREVANLLKPVGVWVWAQCDNAGCQKWRKLPPGTVIDDKEPWFCYMNPSEDMNDCSIPEEEYNEATECAIYSHPPSEISYPSDEDARISDDGDEPWEETRKLQTKRKKTKQQQLSLLQQPKATGLSFGGPGGSQQSAAYQSQQGAALNGGGYPPYPPAQPPLDFPSSLPPSQAGLSAPFPQGEQPASFGEGQLGSAQTAFPQHSQALHPGAMAGVGGGGLSGGLAAPGSSWMPETLNHAEGRGGGGLQPPAQPVKATSETRRAHAGFNRLLARGGVWEEAKDGARSAPHPPAWLWEGLAAHAPDGARLACQAADVRSAAGYFVTEQAAQSSEQAGEAAETARLALATAAALALLDTSGIPGIDEPSASGSPSKVSHPQALGGQDASGATQEARPPSSWPPNAPAETSGQLLNSGAVSQSYSLGQSTQPLMTSVSPEQMQQPPGVPSLQTPGSGPPLGMGLPPPGLLGMPHQASMPMPWPPPGPSSTAGANGGLQGMGLGGQPGWSGVPGGVGSGGMPSNVHVQGQ